MSTPDRPPDAEQPLADSLPAAEPDRDREIAGERGIPSVNRIRSMQARVTNVLALGFVSLMTLGLLAWYYAHTWQNSHDARDRARTSSQQRAQGEMKLPPLPRLQAPRPKPPAGESALWGTAPPAPPASGATPAAPLAYRPQAANTRAAPPPDRRLTGPVVSGEGDSSSDRRQAASASSLDSRRAEATPIASPAERPIQGRDSLSQLLTPTVTPATFARVLPTQRLLLPKGAFIDCTLETAVDTSLQGFVTCLTATDVFGADGSTVLLERGTLLFGETRGEARQGVARVFVVWTEARTPTGVVAVLDSPGTDELGRSGLPGHVNRHFFERFSAAVLVSVIEGAIQRAARPEGGGTVILNPSASTSVATEVLKSTVNIPPTILKHNGERIQILVARDVDFRSVYELRPAAAR